ncbi:MAG: ATP-binding cassette domain-containing protein [Acidimicrobiales bacterium]
MTELSIRNLTIRYSSGGYEVRPIDNLNVEVGSGKLAVLLGPSGCGKTSLLSALAGILSPSSGEIRVGDVEVTELRGKALNAYRRRTVGVMFQAFNLIPSLTALENVQLPLRAAHVRAREAKDRAAALLERFDLGDRMSHRPSELSGGQQQRVAIARAVVHDPPLLLADEPTAHLDYIQVESVLRLLREVAEPGRVVVVATHDERLLPLADEVVELSPRAKVAPQLPTRRVLDGGEVLFRQGDPGDLVYVVESGRVDLVRDLIEGGEELVSQRSPGEYFGELATMFGLPRSATARASGETVVTGYTPEDFQRWAGRHEATVQEGMR